MLSGFSKLFGRDFVVAFFIPSLLFIAANWLLLRSVGVKESWLEVNPSRLSDTTFVAAAIVCFAFLLMSLNRPICRLLAGYWIFDLGRRLNQLQRRQFRKTQALAQEIRRDPARLAKHQEEYTQLMLELSQRFPSGGEALLLPTAFGNTLLAFEDYPRNMYGFEPITGWMRLNAVVPRDFREALDSMRAGTDMWANIWFLSLIMIVEYAAAYFWMTSRRMHDVHVARNIGFDLASVFAAVIASRQAREAAQEWGEWVKATFDVFLPVLCSKLGYVRPLEPEHERNLWLRFSQAITYGHKPSLDELKHFRERMLP